jgi:tetratricopeptide (TPR) repeat protein
LAMEMSGVHNSPNSFKTHDALGSDLFESDRSLAGIDSAIDEAQKSIAIVDPVPDAQNSARPFTNAGIYYERRGAQLTHQNLQSKNTQPMQSYQMALQLLLRARSIDTLSGDRYIAGEKARGKLDSGIAPQGLPQLYKELVLTYLRLGDTQNAYSAAVQARLLDPDNADYGLLSAILSASNRKDEAAIALIEGFMVTRNGDLMAQLHGIYAGGLDSKGCGFVETTGGPRLNYSCEVVHSEICKASSELGDIYRKNQRPETVFNIERRATEEFRCPHGIGQ